MKLFIKSFTNNKSIQAIKTVFFVVALSLTLFSCQDVIDVPLETAPPKLVVEANLLWIKGQTGADQTVKLTTTTDFYSETIPNATGAKVTVSDTDNNVFNFAEQPNSGNYVCSNFVPIINEKYKLKIEYKGQFYEAEETLLRTPELEEVTQETKPLLTDTVTELKFYFQDDVGVENYYLYGVNASNQKLPFAQSLDDKFTDGNRMFGLYRDDKLKTGDELVIGLQSVSKRYFNYLEKLLAIAGTQGGGPFQTPPATVRGNIINLSDKDNFALGYFSLAEGDGLIYMIK
jgi:hypothetical protein